MRIFRTGYEIEWVNVGNTFISGMAWTAGGAVVIGIAALVWKVIW